ncbi:MAG TPA: DUF2269 family protein [Acidimicrobiales bacterium]|nr:DUF2269 family protein [Acidimicrobiales bacterium]
MRHISTLYDILLVIHLMTAIVGFGAVFLNGVYGAKAKAAGGAVGLGIARANLDVTKIGEYLIYSVPVWGILLVITSKKAWDFSQMWISLSFLLFIVGLGISHGVLLRNAKKMDALMEELVSAGPAPAAAGGPPPQVAQLEALGKQQAMAGGVLNVLLIVIVVLMVFKPGA